jgi:hypothetical protein
MHQIIKLMMKNYAILIGIIIGTFLLILATFHYPGGTYENVNSEGYDWANNYISNLLRPLAVNGTENAARPYAILGVLFLTASFGVFFVKFSNRIKIKSASLVIKYLGVLATILGFITVVPSMHDIMVTTSSILTLLIFFYITVMVIKIDFDEIFVNYFSADLLFWCVYVLYKVAFRVYAHNAKNYFLNENSMDFIVGILNSKRRFSIHNQMKM